MKKCSTCKIEKPITDFWKKHGKPKSQCKDCERAGRKKGSWDRAYYERNKEAVRAASDKWRRENPEKYREWVKRNYHENAEVRRKRSREWYAANADAELRARRAAYQRQYQRENPDVMRATGARRRARKRGALVGPAWARSEVYEAHHGLCQHCGVKLAPNEWQEDHKIPLALGGPHSRTNVQPLCPPCNQRKGIKLDFLCRKPQRPLLPSGD